MAIDKLHLFRFVVPKKEVSIFRDILFENGVVHLKNVSSFSKEVVPSSVELSEVKENLKKANYLLNVFQDIQPEKKAFIDNFIPKKPLFTEHEIEKIRDENQFDDVYQEVSSLSERKKEAQQQIDLYSSLITELTPFAKFSFNFSDIPNITRVAVKFLKAEGKTLQDIEQFKFLTEHSVIYPIYSCFKRSSRNSKISKKSRI